MDIAVHGRQVEVPEELRAAAARKVGRLARYMPDVERAEVEFHSERPGAETDVTCQVVVEGRGRVVRATATRPRPATALDEAVDRASQRLSRMKTKLVDRSRPRHHGSGRPAQGPGEGAAGTEGPVEP